MPYIDRESVPGPSVPASYTDGVNTACSTVVTSASLLLPGSRTVRQFGSHLDRRFYRGVLRRKIGLPDGSRNWRCLRSLSSRGAGLRLCPDDSGNAARSQRLSLRSEISHRLRAWPNRSNKPEMTLTEKSKRYPPDAPFSWPRRGRNSPGFAPLVFVAHEYLSSRTGLSSINALLLPRSASCLKEGQLRIG